MRYLRYLVLYFMAVGLIVVALANRVDVSFTLLPVALGELVEFNLQFQVPLYIVIFLGVMIGLLIGFVWEWFREIKFRAAAQTEHRQLVRLEREVTKLKSETVKEQDDVLALFGETS